MSLLIGADPELFVSNGKYVSGHNLIPGTKHEPHVVPRGAIQVDGTAVEFNINPTNNIRSFVKNIKTVKSYLSKEIKKHDPTLELVADPVARYDPDYFNSIPDEAKVLGCDPDYNAYTKKANPIPDNRKTFRTGSGHIHIGWTNGAPPMDERYFNFCCNIVRNLDVYLGLPSLLWDHDNTRRELYGKAGAFRPKHYGLEYRVLSNAWLKDDELTKFVFLATRTACQRMRRGENMTWYIDKELVQDFINRGDANWIENFRFRRIKEMLVDHLGELPRR